MYHIFAMHVLNAVENLLHVSDDLALGQIVLFYDLLEELAASNEFHDHDHVLLSFVSVVQLDQTLVVEQVHHLDLAHHLFARGGRLAHKLGGVDLAI